MIKTSRIYRWLCVDISWANMLIWKKSGQSPLDSSICLLISWQSWLAASWPARIATLICLSVTLGDGGDWTTSLLISTCLSKMLPVEFQEQQRIKVKIWKHFFKFLFRSHLVSFYLPKQITRTAQNQGAEKSYCKEQMYKRIE